MVIDRDDVLRVMRRTGRHDRVDEARRRLPARVDVDRDRALLDEFGLHRERLEEELGSSP